MESCLLSCPCLVSCLTSCLDSWRASCRESCLPSCRESCRASCHGSPRSGLRRVGGAAMPRTGCKRFGFGNPCPHMHFSSSCSESRWPPRLCVAGHSSEPPVPADAEIPCRDSESEGTKQAPPTLPPPPSVTLGGPTAPLPTLPPVPAALKPKTPPEPVPTLPAVPRLGGSRSGAKQSASRIGPATLSPPAVLRWCRLQPSAAPLSSGQKLPGSTGNSCGGAACDLWCMCDEFDSAGRGCEDGGRKERGNRTPSNHGIRSTAAAVARRLGSMTRTALRS
mmetsp:Transcript_46231/g.122582  ORF Transcript_46231/g.122582 Transcript_46231/m.122582 type:complete len:279 (-) Transcript_46231:902-1738(-)